MLPPKIFKVILDKYFAPTDRKALRAAGTKAKIPTNFWKKLFSPTASLMKTPFTKKRPSTLRCLL